MPKPFKVRVKTTVGIWTITTHMSNKNPLPVVSMGVEAKYVIWGKWRIVGSVEGKRLSSTFTSYDISSSAADSVFCTLTGVPEQSSSCDKNAYRSINSI